MNERDPKRKSDHEEQPIGPKHTYRDAGADPETNPSEQPGTQPKTDPQREQPGHTEGPMKPLPDYGDTEPGDPRRLKTSGGTEAGRQAGDGGSKGTPAGGGPSSTLNA